jgi:hypothetical protein
LPAARRAQILVLKIDSAVNVSIKKGGNAPEQENRNMHKKEKLSG